MAGKDRQDLADQDRCDARQEKNDVEEEVRDRSGLPGIHGSKTTRGKGVFVNGRSKSLAQELMLAKDKRVIATTAPDLCESAAISYKTVSF